VSCAEARVNWFLLFHVTHHVYLLLLSNDVLLSEPTSWLGQGNCSP
jgi:hypothetical protein